MNTIFTRSPFQIIVDEVGQTGSKIELFIWNNPASAPTTPTYVLSNKQASLMQTANYYNISSYCQQFINPIYPEYIDLSPSIEDYNNYCNVTVKRYKLVGTYTLIDTTEYIAIDAYNDYLGGYNQMSTDDVVPLFNPNIIINLKINQSSYVNALLNVGDYNWKINGLDNLFSVVDYPKIMKLPITYNALSGLVQHQLDYFTGRVNLYTNEICEVKYTPVVCSFINRYGGWNALTFFKAQTNSIDIKSSDYNSFPTSINYDIHEGQYKTFNLNGVQKVVLNTGWVNENYSELIQDLMLSKKVLLDNKPVKVNTKSTNLKTSLRDKNINYQIEFEYAYNLLNNVL